jgi:hypothetical protein
MGFFSTCYFGRALGKKWFDSPQQGFLRAYKGGPMPFSSGLGAVLALLGLSWWPQFRYGVLVYVA